MKDVAEDALLSSAFGYTFEVGKLVRRHECHGTCCLVPIDHGSLVFGNRTSLSTRRTGVESKGDTCGLHGPSAQGTGVHLLVLFEVAFDILTRRLVEGLAAAGIALLALNIGDENGVALAVDQLHAGHGSDHLSEVAVGALLFLLGLGLGFVESLLKFLEGRLLGPTLPLFQGQRRIGGRVAMPATLGQSFDLGDNLPDFREVQVSKDIVGDRRIVDDAVIFRVHDGNLEEAVIPAVGMGMRHDGDSIAVVKGDAVEVEAAVAEIMRSSLLGEPEGFFH